MILIMISTMAGCINDNEHVDIYVSVYPIEYIVQNIVDEDIVVKSVFPRGQDIHDYDPSPKEIINMANCQLLFYIGSGLETFIENAKTTTLKDVEVYSLSDYLNGFEDTKLVENNSYVTDDVHENAHMIDCHVWLDPIRMIKMSEFIYQKLCEKYPEKTDVFYQNYNKLITSLNQLHQEYDQYLSQVSITKKYIMIDHDAYQYWTQRYGLYRIKLRNDNESSEVEIVEFDKKVELANKIGIKYILSTLNEAKCSMFNNYLRALDAEERSLHHLANISKQEEKRNEDYISLMMYNLNILKEVLPK